MSDEQFIRVEFHQLDSIEDHLLSYAVICSFYKNKIVCVRHRDRSTWEVPGGRREEGESIETTAKRELFEETGAIAFELYAVSEYSVLKNNQLSYGRIYSANIQHLEPLPLSEIETIELFDSLPSDLTYPMIQPKLFDFVKTLENN